MDKLIALEVIINEVYIIKDIRTKSREKQYPEARKAFCYIAYKYITKNKSDIAKFLEVTTTYVLNTLKDANKIINFDEFFTLKIKEVEILYKNKLDLIVNSENKELYLKLHINYLKKKKKALKSKIKSLSINKVKEI